MNRFWVHCLSFLLIISLSQNLSSFAADNSKNNYEAIKAEYFSLKNSDLEFKQKERWHKLAENLDKIIVDDQDQKILVNAIYLNISVYQTLYLISQDPKDLESSLNNINKFVDTYPDNQLADDAILKRAHIYRDNFSDLNAAKSAYQLIIEKYKDSDMYQVAKLELEQLGKLGYQKQDLVSDKKNDSSNQRQNNWPLVVIDPGHGGDDFGSTGVGGLLEKDVTLDVAYRLKNLLESKPGVKVRLTRKIDKFVPLVERTNLANDFEAALFISLHTNASPNSKLHGIETFYLDTSGDLSSKKLAERENQSLVYEAVAGDLQYMISDLIQNAKIGDSIVLANIIQKNLISDLKSKWSPVKDLGVKKALFYVLVGAHMPCVLVELSFIDHQKEGERLASTDFRQDLASSLAGAIRAYLKN